MQKDEPLFLKMIVKIPSPQDKLRSRGFVHFFNVTGVLSNCCTLRKGLTNRFRKQLENSVNHDMQLSNNNLHDLTQANSFLIATSVKTEGKKTALLNQGCHIRNVELPIAEVSKKKKTLARQMSKMLR